MGCFGFFTFGALGAYFFGGEACNGFDCGTSCWYILGPAGGGKAWFDVGEG